MDGGDTVRKALDEHGRVFSKMEGLADLIVDTAHVVHASLRQGHKLLLCGNGGSAADAQHLAGDKIRLG